MNTNSNSACKDLESELLNCIWRAFLHEIIKFASGLGHPSQQTIQISITIDENTFKQIWMQILIVHVKC